MYNYMIKFYHSIIWGPPGPPTGQQRNRTPCMPRSAVTLPSAEELRSHLAHAARVRQRLAAVADDSVPHLQTALCPCCGHRTGANACSQCGTSMEEALALWRQAGASPGDHRYSTQLPTHPAQRQSAPSVPADAMQLEEALQATLIEAMSSAAVAVPEPARMREENIEALLAALMTENVAECHEGDCAVCLSPMESKATVMLPCAHHFHEECVLSWWRHSEQAQCPMCKRSIQLDAADPRKAAVHRTEVVSGAEASCAEVFALPTQAVWQGESAAATAEFADPAPSTSAPHRVAARTPPAPRERDGTTIGPQHNQ